MNDLTLNTANATEATLDVAVVPTVTNLDRFLAGTKSLQRAMLKAKQSEPLLATARLEIAVLKDQVTAALSGTGDFDATSRAFKAAATKLDKLMEANELAIGTARAGVNALKSALGGLGDDIDDLELAL